MFLRNICRFSVNLLYMVRVEKFRSIVHVLDSVYMQQLLKQSDFCNIEYDLKSMVRLRFSFFAKEG